MLGANTGAREDLSEIGLTAERKTGDSYVERRNERNLKPKKLLEKAASPTR